MFISAVKLQNYNLKTSALNQSHHKERGRFRRINSKIHLHVTKDKNLKYLHKHKQKQQQQQQQQQQRQ